MYKLNVQKFLYQIVVWSDKFWVQTNCDMDKCLVDKCHFDIFIVYFPRKLTLKFGQNWVRNN